MILRRTKVLSILAGLVALSAPLAPVRSSSAPPEQAAELAERADAYRAEGQLNSAIIEMKNAIAKEPENAELRFKIGSLYLDAGNGVAAEESFERAMRLGMTDFSIRLALARAWLEQGKYEDILRELDLGQAPEASDKAAVLVLQGRAQLGLRRPAEAREMFEEALEALTRYAPALTNLALLSIREGELEVAERLLKDIELGGQNDRAELLWLQGVLDFEHGNFVEAEQAFQASLAEDPVAVSRWQDLAAAQIKQGDYVAAEGSLRRVLAINPGDPGTTYFRGLLAFLQQDYEDALELTSKLAGTGGSSRALYIAGVSAFQMRSYEQAHEYLSRFVAISPEDRSARVFLAQTMLRMEAPFDAYKTLLPLAEDSESDAAVLSLLGTAAVRAGKVAEGTTYFDKALALRPEDRTLQARRAAAEIALGNEEAGIAELERLIGEDAEDLDLYLPLAAAQLKVGAFEDAVRAAGREPGQSVGGRADASVIQGFGLLGAGEIDAAEDAFEAALRERPDDQDAQLGLAEVKRSQGDVAGGREILIALLDQHPDPVEAAINLAVFEDKAGNATQAILRLEKTLAEHPNDMKLHAALARYTLQDRGPAAVLRLFDSWEHRDDAELLMVRGQAELQADRPQAAANTFRRLLELKPQSIKGHLLLASAYERNREWAKAAETLESALTGDPQQAEVLMARSRVTLLRPDPTREATQAALNAVLELTKTHPRDPRVAELRGLIAWYIERPEEAIGLLTAAHAVLDSADSAAGMAQIQWLAGKRDEAMDTLQTWVERHPDDNYGRYRLARLQLGAGQLEPAVRNLEHSVDTGARRPELALGLAWALARLGETGRAARYAREAYQSSETNPMALYAMGRVYLAEGRAADAVNLFARAMEASGQDSYLRLDYARALVEDGKGEQAITLLDALLAEGGQTFARRDEAVLLRERASR